MSLSPETVKELTEQGILTPDAANDKRRQIEELVNYAHANNIPLSVKIPKEYQPSSGLKTLGEGALSGFSNLGAGIYNSLIAEPIRGIDKALEDIGFSKQARPSLMSAYQVPKEDSDTHPLAALGGEIAPMVAVPEMGVEEEVANAGRLLRDIPKNDHVGGLLATGLMDKHNPAHLGALSAIYGQGDPNNHNFFEDLILGGALGKGAEAVGSHIGDTFKNYGRIVSRRMLRGVNPSQIPAHISDTIRDLYSNKKNAIDTFYSNVLKKAEDRGYTEKGSGNPYKIAGMGAMSPKYKIASPFSSEDAQNLKNNREIDSQLQKRIEDFNKNPTFKNAHFLQSLLAREGNTLATSPLGEQRALGKKISQYGTDLRENIHNKLSQNGDHDLSDLYHEAAMLYRDEIVPYHHSRIWKVIKDKKFNPRPVNLFKNDHEDILKVLEDLDDTDRNRVAYDLFRGNTQMRSGQPEIKDLSKIQKIIDSPQNEHFFAHGNTKDTLEQDIERNDRRNSFWNHVIAGGGLHALGLSSLDTLLGTPIAARLNLVGKLGKAASRVGDTSSKASDALKELLPASMKGKKAPTRRAANALAALLIGGG